MKILFIKKAIDRINANAAIVIENKWGISSLLKIFLLDKSISISVHNKRIINITLMWSISNEELGQVGMDIGE